MKKQDQIYFIVHYLNDNPGTTKLKLKENCITRGVCTQDSFETLFRQLEKKSYIKVDSNGIIVLHATRKLDRQISKSELAQTFVNQGSTDRMIFITPNTNIL